MSYLDGWRVNRAAAAPSGRRVARERHPIVAHLLDVAHERADRLEEGPELRALAETREMPILRVPLDANDVLRQVLRAPRDLVPLAVLGGGEHVGRASVRLLERLRPGVIDRVANVLDDH